MDLDMDPEIAAAMGFSSFGASKKRKLNAGDYAFVDGQQPKSQARAKPSAGSGANMAPLGARKTSQTDKHTSPTHGEASDGAAVAGDRSADSPGNIGSQDDQPSSPSNPGVSKKPKKQAVVPTGLAQFLARGQALQAAAPNPAPQESPGHAGDAMPSHHPPLPARPSAVETASGISGSGEPDLNALRMGVRNESGDLAFFLPSFVEDPWAKLPHGVQT